LVVKGKPRDAWDYCKEKSGKKKEKKEKIEKKPRTKLWEGGGKLTEKCSGA